ncbi:MAG: Arm DNA-binding domain-containing protein, partial [Alphaproteobacteria bacterium]|nr:Arm DNA-binding domain-containing protein [Alphaproteobacteria bacterium]
MVKLTKRFVESLNPNSKDIIIWDEQLPRFGIRVKPSGHKSYILQYRKRNQDFTSKRLTIGPHTLISAEEARIKAQKILARILDGEDPVEDKIKSKNALKVKDLCSLYLKEGV